MITEADRLKIADNFLEMTALATAKCALTEEQVRASHPRPLAELEAAERKQTADECIALRREREANWRTIEELRAWNTELGKRPTVTAFNEATRHWQHLDAQHTELLAERDTLTARVAALEGLLGKLPKTADGVPVVPGADRVFRIAPPNAETCNVVDGIEESVNWNGWAVQFFTDLVQSPEWRGGYDPSKCYSTREAAKATLGLAPAAEAGEAVRIFTGERDIATCWAWRGDEPFVLHNGVWSDASKVFDICRNAVDHAKHCPEDREMSPAEVAALLAKHPLPPAPPAPAPAAIMAKFDTMQAGLRGEVIPDNDTSGVDPNPLPAPAPAPEMTHEAKLAELRRNPMVGDKWKNVDGAAREIVAIDSHQQYGNIRGYVGTSNIQYYLATNKDITDIELAPRPSAPAASAGPGAVGTLGGGK